MSILNNLRARRLGLLALAVILILAALVQFGRWLWLSDVSRKEIPPASAAVGKHSSAVLTLGADAPQLGSLKVETLPTVPLPATILLNGRVTYDENRTARIFSPVLGRVLKITREIGDAVPARGDLAEIDSPDLAQAEADFAKAQADARVKNLALQRAKTLYDGEAIARRDLESAEADGEQAVAESRRARQKLRNLQSSGADDGRFVLRSPIAGVVADRSVNPGLEVRPDLASPLFTVTDPRHLWILVDVPEASIAGIQVGQKVDAEVDAWPGMHFAGQVDRVAVTLDPVTRRWTVRCAIDNPDLKLKPEMFTRVAFIARGDAKAVRVSNTALIIAGSRVFVFVEREPGTFERRPVTVGISGASDSYVTSGLKGGEQVVTEGALLLNAELATQ